MADAGEERGKDANATENDVRSWGSVVIPALVWTVT